MATMTWQRFVSAGMELAQLYSIQANLVVFHQQAKARVSSPLLSLVNLSRGSLETT